MKLKQASYFSAEAVRQLRTIKLKRTYKLGLASLIAGLFLGQSSALAVPGWAQTSANLNAALDGCENAVSNGAETQKFSRPQMKRISSVASYGAAFSKDGKTGIFVHCITNPNRICGIAPGTFPTSSVTIVAFSDGGSGESVNWRDRFLQAVKYFSKGGCGSSPPN